MRRAWALLLACAGCSGSGAPAGPPPPYAPDRRDYAAFRDAHPERELLEPNYLPFMVHALPDGPEGGFSLVFCRWPDDRMPLPVYVAAPEIPDALQDEFAPRDPARYVEAVEEALAMWQGELEGLVRFRRVERRREAELELLLLGEAAPEPGPDLAVLGRTRLGQACHARGSAEAQRLDVAFSVREVRVYLADRHGLLDPDQVEWIALHEIGHALGMRGHSPIPADLMYEVVRDRVRVPDLSAEDVNSFVSLYQLPNGTVYARLPVGDTAPRPPVVPPGGEPRLALAPYVDARLGFQLRPPAGWMRIPNAHGVALVDGVPWDYSASFQVVVQRYATIEAFLDRYGAWYLRHRAVRDFRFSELAGRRALRTELVPWTGGVVERVAFIEAGDGRVFVVTADCPPEHEAAFAPWFEAALGSLEIWARKPRADPG